MTVQFGRCHFSPDRSGIHLPSNKPLVHRTTRITVPSPILSPGLVCRILGRASILIHGNEIKCAVNSTLDGRQVNIECKLIPQKSECLVLIRGPHHEHPRSDIGPEVDISLELERDAVVGGGNAVDLLVLCSFNRAIRSAILSRAAHRQHPFVSIVTVAVVVDFMKPAPVGVKGELAIDCFAGFWGTFSPYNLWVDFGDVLPNVLGCCNGDEKGREK